MANPEHVAILKRGVEAWNEWRKQNPQIGVPDLRRMHLRGAALRGANLSTTNLTGAYLKGSQLTGADLTGANLRKADLSGAYLSEADLSGADLTETRLNGAHFTRAKLHGANLSKAALVESLLGGADLSKANLSGANLEGAGLDAADLSEAVLRQADLNEATLNGVNLNRADLVAADLSGAQLSDALLNDSDLNNAHISNADLSNATLRRAILECADIRFSQLSGCNLTGARLTGAKMYATARDDWIINDIECAYVFWDAEGKIRSPKNGDLSPGEFERLYRTLPTIEYVFQNGMTPLDPLIMDRVVQAIREQNPEYDIQIDSISARGLAPSIKLTVQKEEQKGPALAEVSSRYKAKIRELQGRLNELRCANQHLIDRPGDIHIHITNARGQYLAIDGSTINIDQHVEYITNLRDAVVALPEDSPTFAKKTKKAALDIIGGALNDVAKGQVKKAAELIIELGKDLGPVVLQTAAYAFFRGLGQ